MCVIYLPTSIIVYVIFGILIFIASMLLHALWHAYCNHKRASLRRHEQSKRNVENYIKSLDPKYKQIMFK